MPLKLFALFALTRHVKVLKFAEIFGETPKFVLVDRRRILRYLIPANKENMIWTINNDIVQQAKKLGVDINQRTDNYSCTETNYCGDYNRDSK